MKSRRKLEQETDIALNAFADGEADDATREAVLHSTADDVRLQETLDETTRLKELLAGHVGVEPNPFLAEQIIRNAKETRGAGDFFWPAQATELYLSLDIRLDVGQGTQ